MPDYWTSKTLRELVSISKGKKVITSDTCEQNSIPYIGAKAFGGDFTAFTSSTEAVICEQDDVLILWDGERSGLATTGLHGAVSSTVARLRSKGEVNPHFLYYFIDSKFKWIQERRTGLAVPHVPKDLKDLLIIDLPTPTEQQKITAILSSVDDAIQATQAVIDQTRRVKQGLMQQLLTRGIGHTQFKQTEIGEIPEEWKVYTIGESCSVENNRRKPINAKTREQMKGAYPYYGPTGIIDYINEYRLEGKYVLIGEDGDHFLKYNDWSMTQLVVGKFNVNNHAHVIRGINDCSTEWVFHYFRHRDIISHLTRQGAGRYKLKKATLIELPLAVPPLNEQKKICAFLDSIDQTQESRVNELNHFKVIKRGLMQDLLTGRVRVKLGGEYTT